MNNDDNLEQYSRDRNANTSPYYFIQPDADFGHDVGINESLRNGNYYNESYWKYVPYRNTRANKNHTSCCNYMSNEPIFLTNTGFASCTCSDFGIHQNFSTANDTDGDEKMENHLNQMEIKLKVESIAIRTIEPHATKKLGVSNSGEKNYLRSTSCDGYPTELKADQRRVSMLVDELLLKIYGNCDRKFSSPGTDTNFLEYSTDSSNNLMPLCKNSYFLREKSLTDTSEERCSKWNDMIRSRLMKRTLAELKVQKEALEYNVSYVGSLLIRQLKRRDLLSNRQDAKCNIITAFLQAKSAKRSEDTKIQFSMKPNAGESGFQQWHGAMKMVARLSGGIPREFRKTLWLTLAERHVTLKNINWDAAARNCFNDSTNPDDEELGVQIVKDLHRTGCSLFSGTSGEENQAVLKRVLLAYARWNKTVGYCQGFNMLAALILEVMDRSEYDSLKVMIYLIEGVLPEKYFADNLRGLSIDMAVFRDLLRLKLPELSKHLEELQTDSNDAGNAYEPPLTNVFTMQWFLTLFCNCLPHSTVLRVWDLIFLEGNQILLKTALAIWDTLSDRITPVKSADEFYSIMGVLTREMLEFGLMDANNLIKTITNIELSELTELRERYIYNITPWTQVARKGLRLFYSDDETDDSDEESNTDKMAEGAYGFLKVATKHGSQSIRSISPSSILGPFVNERDKIASDISTLRKQYGKIKERQKQAQIIFKSVHNTSEIVGSMVSSSHGPAINHLLLNKNTGSNVQKASKAQKPVPIPVSVPVPRAMRRLKDIQSSPSSTGEATSKDRGETVYWDERTKKKKRSKAVHYQRDCDSPKSSVVDNFGDSDSSSYSSSTSSFKSSSSTELCDDLGEFDSEDANTSLSEYCSGPHCRLRSSNNSLPEDDKFVEIVGKSDEDLPKSNVTKQELPLDVEQITGERNSDSYNADREQILNVLLTTSIIANEQLAKQDLKDVTETASRNETNSVGEECENEANIEASRHNDEVKLNDFMQNVERITRRVSCISTSASSAIFKTYSVDNINNYRSNSNNEPSIGKKPPPSERENATNSDIEKELENMKINALEILFSSSTLESIRKEACEKVQPVVDDDDSTLRISLTRDTELALQQILQENTEVLKKVNQTSRKTNSQDVADSDSNDYFANTDRLGDESTSIFSSDTNLIDKNDCATNDSIGDTTAKDIRTFEEAIFDYPSEDDRENGESGKKYKSLDSLNKTSKLKMGLIRDSGEWISISIDNSDLNVNVDADDGGKVDNVSSSDTTTSEDESDQDAKTACEPVDQRTRSGKPAEEIRSNSQPPTDPYLHLNFDIIAKGGKKKKNDPIQQYVEQKNILTRASKTRELTANTLNFNPFPSRPHSRPPKELGIKLGLYSSTKK